MKQRLTFIKKTGHRTNPSGNRRAVGLFKCSCGTTKEICISNVTRGVTKSCGCITKEHIRKLGNLAGKDKASFRHGMFGTPFYGKYSNAIQRCRNKNSISYRFYGAIGIKFLYKDFLEFKEDLYESYLAHVTSFGEKQTTLERKNFLGHYEKGNCTWATYIEQARNRRDNLILEIEGKQKTLAEWKSTTGLSAHYVKKMAGNPKG